MGEFKRVQSVTLVVNDQDKAIDFYVNILGWELASDNQLGPDMRWVTVRPKGAETEVALGPPDWFGGKLQPGDWDGLTLVCSEVHGLYADLTAKGVRFNGPVQMLPLGQEGTKFYDPDGNEHRLVGE